MQKRTIYDLTLHKTSTDFPTYIGKDKVRFQVCIHKNSQNFASLAERINVIGYTIFSQVFWKRLASKIM